MRALALVALVAGCATTTAPPAKTPPPPREATALHLSGEAPAAPVGSGAPGSVVAAVYRVCLDDRGAVASATPDPGLPAADESVQAALHKWSWFVVAIGDGPLCWHERVLLAVPSAGHVERQATNAVRVVASHGPPPQPPSWLPEIHGAKLVDAVYKICVGDDAAVQNVRPIVSIAGADDALAASLRASSWDLVVGSLAQAPYCFAAPVRLDLTRTAPTPQRAPASPFPVDAARPSTGVSLIVRAKHLDGAVVPHLPARTRDALLAKGGGQLLARYRLCVAPDGHVASAEPILAIPGDDGRATATLRTWRFDVQGPPGVGFCMDDELAFVVRDERRFN